MEERASYLHTPGKVTGVKCCVCLKSLVLQNYSTHLKMKHPNQNSKDLREKEDQGISVLFNRKRKMADDEGGLKKKKYIDQNYNNAQKLSDEAASTPLPTDDLIDFSDTELNETKN
jgi:macrodomain Ter protein organizer (MatP/YcbG family)